VSPPDKEIGEGKLRVARVIGPEAGGDTPAVGKLQRFEIREKGRVGHLTSNGKSKKAKTNEK
jgi:hypothetical protein